LNKRAAEAEPRPKRLYDAIEAGVADLDDPALKDRIAGLKATRDQAQADALRAQAMLESATHQAVTPQMLRQFANTARKRMRADGGGYRRDHLRLLAQRVEVADKEVRIMGSKSNLLRNLAAISSSGVKSDTLGVPSFVPKWRRACVTNPVVSAGAMVFTTPSVKVSRRPRTRLRDNAWARCSRSAIAANTDRMSWPSAVSRLSFPSR
jgi:site-specific DNA recombinase